MTEGFCKGKGPNRRDIGMAGEEEAVGVLKKKGFKVMERNLRNRFGEIDIIAKDGGTVVFVEVKTRTNLSFGLPKDSLDARKKRHMVAASLDYLSRNPALRECPVRFDCVGIEFSEGGGFSVEHIENAFEADG
ncbi:MAG: YraN family protein [Deltaproteobacteria bacterium]|nr:YraN family protein [Deltaproteobacteria bacterium]